MATTYEVNDNRGCLQIAKDMIFGWCIRSGNSDRSFQPIYQLDRNELEYLNKYRWPAYIPEEFKEVVKSAFDRRIIEHKEKAEQSSTKKQDEQPSKEEVHPAVLKSHISILAEICSKLDLVNGRFVANLKYCRVWREKNRWVVRYTRETDFFETPFPTVEAVAVFIAKRWW